VLEWRDAQVAIEVYVLPWYLTRRLFQNQLIVPLQQPSDLLLVFLRLERTRGIYNDTSRANKTAGGFQQCLLDSGNPRNVLFGPVRAGIWMTLQYAGTRTRRVNQCFVEISGEWRTGPITGHRENVTQPHAFIVIYDPKQAIGTTVTCHYTAVLSHEFGHECSFPSRSAAYIYATLSSLHVQHRHDPARRRSLNRTIPKFEQSKFLRRQAFANEAIVQAVVAANPVEDTS